MSSQRDQRLEIQRLKRIGKELKRSINQKSAALTSQSIKPPFPFFRASPKRTGKVLWWVLLIGVPVVICYYTLFPKIEASKDSDVLDPANPMTAQFVVRNKSIFALHQVETICWLNDIEAQGGAGVENLGLNNQFQTPRVDLPPGEPITVPCAFDSLVKFGNHTIESADIEIIVTYNYWLWPKRLSFASRFVTQRARAGYLKWFAQPKK